MAKFVKAPEPEQVAKVEVHDQTAWMTYWHDAPIMHKILIVLVFAYATIILFGIVSSRVARRQARAAPPKKTNLSFESHWESTRSSDDDRL